MKEELWCHRKAEFALSFLFFFCFFLLSGAEYRWFAQNGDGKFAEVPVMESPIAIPFKMPGNFLLFQRASRTDFRHDPALFQKSHLSAELKVAGDFTLPLKAWLFIKDKDGNWYQSEQEYRLFPGEWTTLTIPLTYPGKFMLPVGHNGAWNASLAAAPYEFGVSVYSEEDASGTLECGNLSFTGSRIRPALNVTDWHLPSRVRRNETFESRFQLSREYFNPFDPDEIEVNYEIELPGNTIPAGTSIFELCSWQGKKYMDPIPPVNIPAFQKSVDILKEKKIRYNLRYPAFYGQDFIRRRHFTREHVTPSGAPYWAFRMMPNGAGDYRIRLHILDNSGEKTEEYFTEWRNLHVDDSTLPGPVRVSLENPSYFEFANGDFFYPVGLNIHANTDIRSEFQFKWGHLPDRGTYDFDDYLNACGRSGINLVEVWMASWTYAVEWDSARPYYYGLGRYNMANAWKLDYIFDLAEKNGIYLNLVLDAHGKISNANDQEWEDNPFNAKAAFAVANNGFLEKSQDFWSDGKAQIFNWKRNRYIMARWGAETNLFAVELWSEVNIVTDGWNQYQSEKMTAWHRNAAREIRAMNPANHLLTTHICGDSGSVLSYRKLSFDEPLFTHIACNAYRGSQTHILDQLKRHGRDLSASGKPLLVMEYGGTHLGGADNNVRADVHAGLWASLFGQQAGTPCLWWHDFIHLKNMYSHFAAFSAFLNGIDLRKGTLVNKDGSAIQDFSITNAELYSQDAFRNPFFLYQKRLTNGRYTYPALREKILPGERFLNYSLLAVGSDTAIGWLHDRALTWIYPTEPEKSELICNAMIPLALPLKSGDYLLQFYDTLTGNVISSSIIYYEDSPRLVPVPPFRIDTGIKLTRLSGGQESIP